MGLCTESLTSPLAEASLDRLYHTDRDETETQGGQAVLQAVQGCPHLSGWLCPPPRLPSLPPLIPLSGHIVSYFCILLYICAHSLEASSAQHTHLKLVLGGRQMF